MCYDLCERIYVDKEKRVYWVKPPKVEFSKDRDDEWHGDDNQDNLSF